MLVMNSQAHVYGRRTSNAILLSTLADRRTLSAMFVFGAKTLTRCKHCNNRRKIYCKMLCRHCYNNHGNKYPTLHDLRHLEFLSLIDKILKHRERKRSYTAISIDLNIDIKTLYRMMAKARKLGIIPHAREIEHESKSNT